MSTPRPEPAPSAQPAPRAGGSRRPVQRPGTGRREFVTKVSGLETHTFDIGHAKYAAKFKKSLEEIANYVQQEYKGGPDMGKALRDLALPTLTMPAIAAGADPVVQFL